MAKGKAIDFKSPEEDGLEFSLICKAGTLDCSASLRIGAPLLFGRLWEQSGCRQVIEQLARRRGFGFSLERAVFVGVLHRLMVSGSDRACEKWLDVEKGRLELQQQRLDDGDVRDLRHEHREEKDMGDVELPSSPQHPGDRAQLPLRSTTGSRRRRRGGAGLSAASKTRQPSPRNTSAAKLRTSGSLSTSTVPATASGMSPTSIADLVG